MHFLSAAASIRTECHFSSEHSSATHHVVLNNCCLILLYVTWDCWSLLSSLDIVLLQATAGNTATSDMPTQMALVCSRQQAPKPGQEITISYGDKSNEHLLMAYGEHASSPTH